MKNIINRMQRIMKKKKFGYDVVLPKITPHIFLIGVSHACQYSTELSRLNLPIREGGSDKAQVDQAFANFLHEAANKISAEAICEEMSEEFLTEIGNARSIAKIISQEYGCLHVFCDPDRKQREIIKSDYVFNNLDFSDELLNLYGKNLASNEMYREGNVEVKLWLSEQELKENYRRELFWLQQMVEKIIHERIIFICGSNHIETFSNILNSRGFLISIIESDFSNKKIEEYAISRVYDPTILGPFNLCFGCHEEKNPNYTFCLNCGRRSGDFLVDEDILSYHCVDHQDVSASNFCSSCGEPKCMACFASGGQGVNMSMMLGTQYCDSCMKMMDAAEIKFSAKSKNKEFCTYHCDDPVQHECAICENSLCNSCTYYTTDKHKKRIVGGPFCLTCFRAHTLYGNRTLWTSPVLPNFSFMKINKK